MSFIQALLKPSEDEQAQNLKTLSLKVKVPHEAADRFTQLVERLADTGIDGNVNRHSLYHWLTADWPVLRRHEGRKNWLNVYGPYWGRPWFERPLGGRLKGPNAWVQLSWDQAHRLDQRIQDAIDAEIKAYCDEKGLENRLDRSPDRKAWDDQAKAEIADALIAFSDGPEPQDDTTFHCHRETETNAPERCRLTCLEQGDTLLVGILTVVNGHDTWTSDCSHKFLEYLRSQRFSHWPKDKIRWVRIGRPNPEEGIPFHFIEYILSVKDDQFEDCHTRLISDLPPAFVAQAKGLLKEQTVIEATAYKSALNGEKADA
ncbi:MAG: hypothetical protein AAF221_10130 [Pseudomonadota bacterium]